MGPVAPRGAGGLGRRRDLAVEDRAIGGVVDGQAASCERRGRDLVAFVIQSERSAEDMAQHTRPLGTRQAVDLDGVGQVTALVGERTSATSSGPQVLHPGVHERLLTRHRRAESLL
jgi:hypothetical protein